MVLYCLWAVLRATPRIRAACETDTVTSFGSLSRSAGCFLGLFGCAGLAWSVMAVKLSYPYATVVLGTGTFRVREAA